MAAPRPGMNLSSSCNLYHSCGNTSSFNPLCQFRGQTHTFTATRSSCSRIPNPLRHSRNATPFIFVNTSRRAGKGDFELEAAPLPMAFKSCVPTGPTEGREGGTRAPGAPSPPALRRLACAPAPGPRAARGRDPRPCLRLPDSPARPAAPQAGPGRRRLAQPAWSACCRQLPLSRLGFQLSAPRAWSAGRAEPGLLLSPVQPSVFHGGETQRTPRGHTWPAGSGGSSAQLLEGLEAPAQARPPPSWPWPWREDHCRGLPPPGRPLPARTQHSEMNRENCHLRAP